MKKLIILTTCLTALIAFNSSATIWRVNNTGRPADFTTIQAAHNATTVLAGDTLHIEPSGVSYGDLTSTKALVILGPGYFLNQNANQQANPAAASLPNITLNAGSSGTEISGLTVTASVYINTGNITISRNYIGGSIYLFRDVTYSNSIISGNYIINDISGYGSSNVPLITNVLIFNNLFSYINLSTQFSGTIANNIIMNYNSTIYYFTVKNNIFYSTINSSPISGSFNTINNNLSASPSGLPAGNGNQNNIPMTSVFVGATGNSTDGQWQLAAGSPASGAGLSGEDCGMYGGNTPYRLSGLPKIPSVYFLSAPATSSGNTLPVIISVKTNN